MSQAGETGPRTRGAETTDVLIVGAGLSGVGAACQLRQEAPEKSVMVLEARDAIGGTWDLFRYPGIRSDSDMFTLGYRFSPWTDPKAIADGPSILRYIHNTAQAFDVDKLIRLNHRVVNANWDSDEARWTVEVHRTDTDDLVTITCSFLYVCTGYYRYDEGFSPKFPGVERYERLHGPVIHPQHWPEDLDYRGKRVVVIGSGATAVTLVPTLAESAAHVTMLQRSPTYVASRPASDATADRLRAWLPQKLAYAIVRWKNALQAIAIFNLSRRRPETMKSMLRKAAVKQLPEGYAVDTHFAPSYNPWDQRMCLVPDGDLFTAIRDGRASVITDHIETFTESGIRLQSGAELQADIVVSATGLNLLAIGGMQLEVDGARGGPVKDVVLQGNDALGRAELRVDDRLHERVVDAEGRSGGRVRVPAAQMHGRERLRRGDARRGRCHRGQPVPGPGVGLRQAQPRGAAQAGRSGAVAAASELRQGRAPAAPRTDR
jgi:monooxygenase